MKKILLIISLMVFFNAKAKNSHRFLRANPYKKATLYLKNGETISNLDIKLKSKYFKQIIERYFSDCKELVSRIEFGFYKKNEILSILNCYNKDWENENCL
jgi:hypothetical protein